MKKLLTLLSLLICTSLMINAQHTAPKHSNTIQINTSATLDDVVVSLRNHGFNIDTYDKDLQTIQTKTFKLYKSSTATGSIFVYTKNESLFITAYASNSVMGGKTEGKMEKRGTGNIYGKCFELVNEFALQFAKEQQASITYLTL